MRISRLLVVILCGLVSVCGASDPLRQSSSPQTTASSFSEDQFDSSTISQHDFLKLPVRDYADREHWRSDSERDRDVTCYTMHIFGMKRDSPHSDVTEPDGQSTCLPSSKYSVRMLEEPGKAPSR